MVHDPSGAAPSRLKTTDLNLHLGRWITYFLIKIIIVLFVSCFWNDMPQTAIHNCISISLAGSILTTAHLKTVKVVQVDSGDALPVQVFSGRTVYINGVQMITSDIPATNGIIHILKGVISSKFTKFTPTASPAGAAEVYFFNLRLVFEDLLFRKHKVKNRLCVRC